MKTSAELQGKKCGDDAWDLLSDHPANAVLKSLNRETGELEFDPPRDRWAVVGFASSTRDLAPFNDPSWVVCGLNQLYRHIPRADVWFEIHARPVFEADVVRDTDYVRWLRESGVPVVMLEQQPDMPRSARFPIEVATEWIGRDYWQSSIAYMVAYAALHGAKEIGVWGVDLVVGQEYEYQKANLEYILGLCHARGITVTLPDDTALLKQLYRYGPDIAPRNVGPVTAKLLEDRYKQMQDARDQLLTKVNACEGAMAENRAMMEIVTLTLRGAKVMTG